MSSGAEFDRFVAEVENSLRMVNIIVRKRGRQILADFEVTPPQLDALNFLNRQSLTMGELGQKMHLACSTATDLIDRMERNGLIVRERDTQDRRVIRLYITDRGREIISQVVEARKRYLAEVLANVPPEQRQALKHSLSILYDLMKGQEVR